MRLKQYQVDAFATRVFEGDPAVCPLDNWLLVASPLVMWLGVSREQFIVKPKVIEGANEDGAVI